MASEIALKISADIKNAQVALKRLQGNLGDLGSQVKRTNPDLQKFKDNWKSIGLTFVGLGFVFAKMIQKASDLQETTNKFSAVFKDVSDEAEKMARDLQDAYGLGVLESKKLLSNTADLLTGFGIQGKEALSLSAKVQKLSVDLASFTNIQGGASRASEALTKAMLGEREMTKALGIVIREKDVLEQASLIMKESNVEMTLQQAKAEAVYQIALSQSVNAIGDYQKTQHTFANQWRLFGALTEDVTAQLGEAYLPTARNVVSSANNLLKAFRGLNPETKQLVANIGAVGAVMGTLGAIAVTLGTGVALITGAFIALGAAIVAVAVHWDEIVATWEFGIAKVKREFQLLWSGIKIGFLFIAKTAQEMAAKIFQPLVNGINVTIQGYNRLTGSSISSLKLMAGASAKALGRQLSAEKRKFASLKRSSKQEIDALVKLNKAKRKLEQDATSSTLKNAKNESMQKQQIQKSGEEGSKVSQVQFLEAMRTERQLNREIEAEEDEFEKEILKAKLAETQQIIADANRSEVEMNKVKRDLMAQEDALAWKQAGQGHLELSNFVQGSLNQNIGWQFRLFKALAIQTAIIDTWAAATAAQKAMSGIPFVGPALGIAAAGVAIAAGIARVGKIKATKPPKAATGALIRGSVSGSPIIAGEGGRDEAIIPLQNREAMNRLAGAGAGMGQTINLTINVENSVGDITDDMISKIDDGLQTLFKERRGSVFAEEILQEAET